MQNSAGVCVTSHYILIIVHTMMEQMIRNLFVVLDALQVNEVDYFF